MDCMDDIHVHTRKRFRITHGVKTMIENKVRNKILSKTIFLDKFAINDLAWSKQDALELIDLLLNDEIGILGGDVFIIEAESLTPAYANWYSTPGREETLSEFYLRSKKESKAYIDSYPLNHHKSMVFTMTFTETVSRDLSESENDMN